MNNETNRLAQLIANAADKELAVRQDGQPRRQDKAAAEAIEAEYLFIRRDELPVTGYVERDGKMHVQVDGSEAGTWPVRNNAATNRRWGLEYLAASFAIQEWHDKEAERSLTKRRDELAGQFRGEGIPYADLALPLKLAIDHIIEIEKAA